MFHKELMVTAFDVKYGKPNPEPYLMALKKGGIKADEAVVVENAPLGVEAGHNAGIFTIAVNTGPLNGQVLLDAGADVLVSGSAFFGHKPYDARLAAFMKAAEGRAVRPGLRAARAWRHAASNANP